MPMYICNINLSDYKFMLIINFQNNFRIFIQIYSNSVFVYYSNSIYIVVYGFFIFLF